MLLDCEDDMLRRVTFSPDRYRSFDHGYAVTIHKSQGATVDQLTSWSHRRRMSR
ncbi:hypothetical protein QBK99_25120 [Corticibacterium sp. UT-5YL-CI-8]|nr:hypothetical protein [Tianweitania sp. UT-5YL-CI-8]